MNYSDGLDSFYQIYVYLYVCMYIFVCVHVFICQVCMYDRIQEDLLL